MSSAVYRSARPGIICQASPKLADGSIMRRNTSSDKQKSRPLHWQRERYRHKTACWLVPLFAITFVSVTRADATDDYVRAEMVKRKIPALSVAVIRDGHVVKEAAFGVANVELSAPATLNTVYTLASMTKVFTAAAIMLLVQEGRISLDEPVSKILPQLPSTWSAVTIRHCLSHTSGLPDAFVDDINATAMSGDLSSLLEALAKIPASPAGERSVYNQTDYILLGMIIEKIGGLSYENFVRTRLLKPAGMSHASFGDAWQIVPGRADLYTALDITPDHSKLQLHDGEPVLLHDKILHYGSKYWPDYMAPAALLNGSIGDLVNWEKALASGKLVNASSLNEMIAPSRLPDGKVGDFGFGFFTKSFRPNVHRYAMVSYGGGAATWRLAIPEKHLIVIILTNLQDSEPEKLTLGIASIYEPSISESVAH
jgi:D-alanyl-D-alanine carboxypeptidase